MSYNFNYISKHNPEVQKVYNELQEIIREVHNILREEITFQSKPVGSYSRNMITFDLKSNIGYDLDFNFDIQKMIKDFSAKEIHTQFLKALNQVTSRYDYSPTEENTRVLTIKVKDKKNSRILHSCDIAIVNNYIDNDGKDHQEYIRFDRKTSRCSWCEQADGFYMLPEKIAWLKDNDDLWDALRDYYLIKKNSNPDPKKFHSRDLFGQAVHETCQRNGYYE